MSSNKIFCSYSALDEEVVSSIIQTLKVRGFDIWVGKLDIKPGERWDESIQNALENSDSLLVFMSKQALQSSMVMDEVSFALEEGKRVIPVFLENLEHDEVPHVIKRIQWLDLFNDFDKGMEVLIKALISPNTLKVPEGIVVTDINNFGAIGNKVKEEDLGFENIIFNVFISYNHGDLITALRIRDLLKKSGIEVTIDQDNMHDGQEIKNFINESIQKANAVLTLISNKSLKSGWVGVETFDTMFAETQNGQRKLIGCVLDSDFYNYDYTLNTIEGLDEEIDLRKKVLVKQLERDVSVTDISSEIDRLRNLRNNFPETMKRLRDFKCIDVSDDEIIDHNMEKFVNQLRRTSL